MLHCHIGLVLQKHLSFRLIRSLNTLRDFKYNDFSVKNKLCSRNN